MGVVHHVLRFRGCQLTVGHLSETKRRFIGGERLLAKQDWCVVGGRADVGVGLGVEIQIEISCEVNSFHVACLRC